MPKTPVRKSPTVIEPKQAPPLKPVTPATKVQVSPRVLKARKAADKAIQELADAEEGAKSRRLKIKDYRFPLTEAEHDALLALKHVVSDSTGTKVKKSALMRVAIRLLLKHPHAKLEAEISALTNVVTT